MSKLRVEGLIKIYPFVKPGLLGRKRDKKQLEKQKRAPFTTNEGVIALRKVSFSIDEGEFVVILGESGCGKSTLLRIIAGLTDATVGSVYIDDEDVTALRPEDRNLSMIFQNYALYPHLTVYNNIAFSLQTKHIPREEIDEQVQEVAKALKIEDLLDRRPGELSGGEQQRVAIGRAIIRNPNLFLMDEPFSNLDVNLRRQMRMIIKDLYEKMESTFLYVTHDQNEAFSMGTKIILMHQGAVEQVGTPDEIYDHPETVYAAMFIGSPGMNILPGNLFQSSIAMGSKKLDQNNILVGIRPAELSLMKTAPTDDIKKANLLLHAKVDHINHLGSEVQVAVAVTDGKGKSGTVLVDEDGEPYLLTVTVPADGSKGDFRMFENVTVVLPKEQLHFFDAKTWKRIDG